MTQEEELNEVYVEMLKMYNKARKKHGNMRAIQSLTVLFADIIYETFGEKTANYIMKNIQEIAHKKYKE